MFDSRNDQPIVTVRGKAMYARKFKCGSSEPRDVVGTTVHDSGPRKLMTVIILIVLGSTHFGEPR